MSTSITVPKTWREFPQRYRLEASKCKNCGKIFFPPRPICSNCKYREFIPIKLPKEGKIYSFTIIRTPSSEFKDYSPFAIAIIELDNGIKLMCQVVDCDFSELEIGKRVSLVFRKIQEDGSSGIIAYGYKGILEKSEL
ncbi:MAG: Zn-ribbon domain-containing OB-fold protein [Atribacterota bacterium]|nr:Zn-ribbon domain-containing OB-fold protein [Atribacterota bacterium]MDD4896634.1 Zn-ribbon domain-containing OB-fold protein [Atribacterota bacterium]MDD5636647.1 Zn-ribbon domain-containing OB-fold protein [Atribacterota bacterium]